MPAVNVYINEKHKDFLQILAYVYVQNNQFEKAITVYKALWSLFPESEKIAFCLSYLYLNTQQFETSLYYANAFLSKHSSDLGHLIMGQALIKLGRNHEAREAISRFFI